MDGGHGFPDWRRCDRASAAPCPARSRGRRGYPRCGLHTPGRRRLGAWPASSLRDPGRSWPCARSSRRPRRRPPRVFPSRRRRRGVHGSSAVSLDSSRRHRRPRCEAAGRCPRRRPRTAQRTRKTMARDRQAARRARRGVSSYGFPRSADGERPYVRLGRDRLRSRPRVALERVAMMNGESRNCLPRSMIEKVHAIVRNVH